MKTLPASAGEWMALLLIPFKVFVPFGYLALVIQRNFVGYRHDDTRLLATMVVTGYMVSFCVLVLGAVIQLNIGPRRAYFSTYAFIAALLVFVWLTSPYMAHA